MKKGLLLVVVMLATIAVKAQDIYVGGSLNVWRNSTGNTTSFKGKRLRDSILSPFFHSYIFAMYKNEALWI